MSECMYVYLCVKEIERERESWCVCVLAVLGLEGYCQDIHIWSEGLEAQQAHNTKQTSGLFNSHNFV